METAAPVGSRGAERGGGSAGPCGEPPGAGPVVAAAAAATNAAFAEDPPPYSPPDPRSAHLLCPPLPALPGPGLSPPGPFLPQGLPPRTSVRPPPARCQPLPPLRGLWGLRLWGGAHGGRAARTPCPVSQRAPSTAAPSAAGHRQPQPKDYLVESVLVTAFCCLLTGLGALSYSQETRAALGRGDMAQAYAASRKAQCLVLFSLLFGLFASISWVIYVLVALYL
ncbi:proline rich transmembrane protein 1B isoform X1 [Lathamus discolor]|uniref:proline rich transmembrane protein 1B isoform X1 n=1 Tax=Lathamus discolor TaxID=678569 RepID=UPI0032B74681